MWPSTVGHLPRAQGVAGSNPATQTSFETRGFRKRRVRIPPGRLRPSRRLAVRTPERFFARRPDMPWVDEEKVYWICLDCGAHNCLHPDDTRTKRCRGCGNPKRVGNPEKEIRKTRRKFR